MVVEEPLGRPPAGAVQQFEKIIIGLQLAGRGEPHAESAEINAVDVEAAIFALASAAGQAALIDELIHETHRAQLGNQSRIESDFVQPIDDLGGGARCGLARYRIDLYHQHIFGICRMQERKDRRGWKEPFSGWSTGD